MPRILLAWEHGRHQGHAARLHAMAVSLAARGASVCWALPTQGHGLRPMLPAGQDVYDTPRLAPGQAPPPALDSYADVLAALGLADARTLEPAVRGWIKLMRAARADSVVLDYAPVAQLAALCAGLPALRLSNGFDVPPPDLPLFSLRSRTPCAQAWRLQTIARIDDAMNTVGKRVAGRERTTLRDGLSAAQVWLDGVPETDPYGPRPHLPWVGPIGRPPLLAPARWPDTAAQDAAPRVFVYWRGARPLRPLLHALVRHRARVLCVWPDAPDQMTNAVATAPNLDVKIHRVPVDLRTVLADADLVVNYGSSTLVAQTLLSGIPQVMAPADVEKWMVAQRVVQAGAGLLLPPDADAAAWQDTIDAALIGQTADALRHAAARIARAHVPQLAARRRQLVERVLTLANRGDTSPPPIDPAADTAGP